MALKGLWSADIVGVYQRPESEFETFYIKLSRKEINKKALNIIS